MSGAASHGANNAPGDHGADEPWVECPKRVAQHAVDSLGPVIAHGYEEAPGYNPGLLNSSQKAFLSHASLHRPSPGGFFYEKLSLPSADPNDSAIADAVTGAIRAAGQHAPAEAFVSARRTDSFGAHTRLIWDVGFVHKGVRVAPAGCQLAAEHGRIFPASLSCRLPPSDGPLHFDAFHTSASDALQIASKVTGIAASHHDVRRLYVADDAHAKARIYVVLSDGLREMLAVLDGAGNAVSAGSNERNFTFDGYDLDYVSSARAVRATQMPVGDGQDQLDTANFDAANESCVYPTSSGDFGQYPTGFAICGNNLIQKTDETFTQPLVPVRADDDYTNAKSKKDPYPPQIIFSNADSGAPLAHGNRGDLPVRPIDTLKELLKDYIRLNVVTERPFGPVHESELQGFASMGKLEMFYGLLDTRFEVAGQDRFRTQVTVHWNPSFDDPDNGPYNNARASRFLLKFADWQRSGDDYAFDGTSDGSVVAHEYHHHIQESLASDDAWELTPGTEILFPTDPNSPSCSQDGGIENCRRDIVLEGLADGFAALLVNRGIIGTISRTDQPLDALLGHCTANKVYGSGDLGDLVPYSARSMCNNEAFGLWDEIETTFDTDPCTRSALQAQQFGRFPRANVIGGATYLYSRRFSEWGAGPAIPARHLLEAERTLALRTDGEVEYFGALLAFLHAAPAAETRRFEYTARASFIEKGVFPPLVQAAYGGDDARPNVRCDLPTCGGIAAFKLTLLTLTMSGPFSWKSTTEAPEFDLFAPPGTSYQTFTFLGSTTSSNIVWMELSDNANFSSTGGGVFRRVPAFFDPKARINCAPPGFFRLRPPLEAWQAVRNAAIGEGDRVYYRVRQCPASVSLANVEGCLVSTTAQAPAYVEVAGPPGGGGGSCLFQPFQPSMIASRGNTRVGWTFAVAALALALRRFKDRKRNR